MKQDIGDAKICQIRCPEHIRLEVGRPNAGVDTIAQDYQLMPRSKFRFQFLV